MTEHVWVQENLAAYLAGGLTPAEGERLQRHLAECPACALLTEEGRALERRLQPLYLAGNPGPALEDRLIRSLRAQPTRRLGMRWSAKYLLVLGSAAAVLLAGLGAIVSELTNADMLTFGGNDKRLSANKTLFDRFGWSEPAHTRLKLGVDLEGGTILVYEGDKIGKHDGPKSADALAKELRGKTVEGIDSAGPGFVQGLREGDDIVNRFPDGTSQTITFSTKPTNRVLVAKKSLETGQRFKAPEELFEYKEIQKDQMPKDAITDFKELRGRTLGIPRQRGESISANDLVSKNLFSVEPPAGERAVGVKVNNEMTAGGWASLPGNRVDIVLLSRKPDDKSSGAQVVLQNVKVLAIDDKEKREENGKPMNGGVAMLGLMPEDALKLDVARSMGSLSLMVRPKDDDKMISSRKVTVQEVFDNKGADNGEDQPKEPESRFRFAKDELVWQSANGGKLAPIQRPTQEQGKAETDDGFRQRIITDTDTPAQRILKSDRFGKFKEVGEQEEPTPVPPSKLMPAKKNEKEKGEDKNLADQQKEIAKLAERMEPPKENATEAAQKAQSPVEPAPAPPPIAARKIIRTGELEFEVDSFDGSYATIMRLINATKGAFVATTNSDRLPNRKMQGSVVVRMPPELLDNFVLDLRKELAKVGELKNQKISSEDVTKHYSDVDSQLRAARAMEERLLAIIKDGKGQIKDLLQAEKELGIWRTKIEEYEGDLRFFNNLVSLSTLTIKLYEKDIRLALSITESERVVTGIEAEDVEKAYREALKAVADAKGRVSRSELKQHAAGQFNAILNFEVSPDAAGPMRDRLKQLGNTSRLQVDRVQQTADGGTAASDGKIERGNTQFDVSIYNLATATPRETVLLRIAAADVKGQYDKLREAIAKAKGYLLNAEHDGKDPLKVQAQIDFDLRRQSEGDVQATLDSAGELLSRQVNRIPESANVTDSKVLYRVTLLDVDSVQPREKVVTTLAGTDVRSAYQKLHEALAKVKARVINTNLDEQDRRKVSAQVDFSFSRADEAMIQAALKEAGESLSRQVTRLPAGANVTDTKLLAHVTLIDRDALLPRETENLKIAAVDVRAVYETLRKAIATAKGRIIHDDLDEKDRRNVVAELQFEIPRADEAAFRRELDNAGETLTRQVVRQPENTAVTDAKVGFKLELSPASRIPPRETTVLLVEVADVEAVMMTYDALVKAAQGRTVETQVEQDKTGLVNARITYDVPFSSAGIVAEKLKPSGQVRFHKVTRDPQAPEGKLALGRLVVTLSSGDPNGQGLGTQVGNGLSISLRGLSFSLNLILIGLLFLLPWALVGYGGYWVVRRMAFRTPRVPVAGTKAPAEKGGGPK